MKIFLAGVESTPEHSAAVCDVRAPHVLCSFFHAAWKRPPRTFRGELMAALSVAQDRLVDSGAFTLRTAIGSVYGSGHSNETGKGTDFDIYADAYIDWLRYYRKYNLFDWWVEMDIGAVVGQEWVHSVREKFLRAGLGDGLINVWHSEHDWDYWLYLLREAKRPGRSRYVAIEGHQPTRPQLDYNRFLHEAYRQGVRVHGFKMTIASDLRKWPFYSVDSTSWIVTMYAGAVPGTSCLGGVVQGRPLPGKRYADKGIRLMWRAPIPRRQGRSWRKDILRVSALEWIKASRQLTDYWLGRGVDWERAVVDGEAVVEAV